MNSELLSVVEVARLLNVSRTNLYAKAKSGEIPCFRVGALLRFDRAELEAWLQERRTAPAGHRPR